MTEEWYYTWQGQRLGPVPAEQLQQLVASGQLPVGELVWKEGLPAWIPPQTVPGLGASAPRAAVSVARANFGNGMPNQAGNPAPPESPDPEPRRRKRKKKRKEKTGSGIGWKIGLIAGLSVLAVALVLVLILFVILPLFDPASPRSFSGSYTAQVPKGQIDAHKVSFKEKHWVTIHVTNQGFPAAFHVGVKDPANNYIALDGANNTRDPHVSFEVRQTGEYTIEIRNLGIEDSSAVVAYKVR